MSQLTHYIKGEDFILLPEKAIYWPSRKALLLADLHLGKVTHFRKAGIGLPKEVESENLDRLAQLILNNDTKLVYLLGDLFHSQLNKEWAVFKTFMSKFPEIKFILIKGNHDILQHEAYVAPNIVVYQDYLILDPFILTHIPLEENKTEYYNICGHIHPGVVLRGKGLQTMKLPCFHFTEKGLTLPAFGSFTGTAKIDPERSDSIYAISDNSVIKVL